MTTTATAAGTRRYTGTFPADPAQVRLRGPRSPCSCATARPPPTWCSSCPNRQPPEEAARITCFLADHLRLSAFWDKKHGVWRVAEDDPDSDLYAESSDADTVIGYITAHA